MTAKAFLVEPIRKLSARYEAYVVSNLQDPTDLDCMQGMVTAISVPIHRKVSLLADFRALISLIVTIRRHGFDAVHSVTPKAGLLAMLAAFFCRVPVRIHIFTGQVWATRKGIKRFVLKAFDWLIARLATHVLVDSLSQRQFLVDEGVVSAKKAEVLADGSISGVNLDRFKPDARHRESVRHSLSLNAENILILYLGRLNRDKGVLDLVRAFVSLDYPHVHLLMVGPDEDGMLASLKNEARQCHDRVHFIDFTDKPEEYMAAADIFCLPSYREGFGSVVIEAAAVGVPSVGSRIYGLTDAIADNFSGLLFEAGNVDDLASKLRSLIESPELTIRLGAQARQRAQERFSSELVSAAWDDYYRRLL